MLLANAKTCGSDNRPWRASFIFQSRWLMASLFQGTSSILIWRVWSYHRTYNTFYYLYSSLKDSFCNIIKLSVYVRIWAFTFFWETASFRSLSLRLNILKENTSKSPCRSLTILRVPSGTYWSTFSIFLFLIVSNHW